MFFIKASPVMADKLYPDIVCCVTARKNAATVEVSIGLKREG
jgi:hypothetical protein